MTLQIKSIEAAPALGVVSVEPDNLGIASVSEPSDELGGLAKVATKITKSLIPPLPTAAADLVPDIPGQFEDLRKAEEAGTQARGYLKSKVGEAVEKLGPGIESLPPGIKQAARASTALYGTAADVALDAVPFTPKDAALYGAAELAPALVEKHLPGVYDFLTKERGLPAPVPDLKVAKVEPSRLEQFDKFYTPSSTPGEIPETQFVRNNLDKFAQAYDKAAMAELKTDVPNYVSADLAKTVEVEGRPSFKSEFSASRHESGSAFAKVRYQELLDNPETVDKPVLISAGISGAGKTSGIKSLGVDTNEFAAVLDTNLASFGSAKRAIDSALDSSPGREVNIYFVHRDPIQAFENGVFRRFENHPEHRIVPIDAFLSTLNSKEAAVQVAELYKTQPRVKLYLFDNDVPKRTPPRDMTIDELKNVVYNKDELRGVLDEFVQQKYQAGKLTKSEAETFLGNERGKSLRPSSPEIQRGPLPGSLETGQPASQKVAPLTEPQLKLEGSKGITEEAKKFFSNKPPGFQEVTEAARINVRIANLIKSGQTPVESIPIFKEYGYTNADRDLVADMLTQQATYAGKALNLLSQVKQAIPESALLEIPSRPLTAWERIAGRFSAAATSTNSVIRSGINLWRVSLTSQLKTAIRNAEVTAIRFPLKILDDASVGAVEALTGLKQPKEAFGPAIEDIFSIWRSLTPTGRGRIQSILADEPLAMKRLYGSPVSDVTMGNRYSKLVSTFNTTQEFFNRDLVFDATLTGELKYRGVKTLGELPDAVRVQVLKKAVDGALEMTMAAAGGKYSQSLIKFFNDYPILQVVGYPFPRFLANSVKAMFDWSPFGATRLLSPEYAKILASSDKRAAIQVASRAALGSTVFASAIYLRNSKYAGQKWYEIRPDPDRNPGKVVDLRPFAPIFPTYLFLAEAMKDPSRMENRDWVEGALGVNRIAGTTLYMTSLLSGMGPDSLKKAVVQLTGEFLGGFSTSIRTFKDFVAQFSKEERIPRETLTHPITGPFQANIPWLSQKLPPRYSATAPEPHAQEAPAKEQLTGLRSYTKNAIEQEIDRVGLKSSSVNPKTGIPEADNEIRKVMGQVIERQLAPLVDSTFYKNVSTPVKREILKAEIGKLREDVTSVLFGNSMDLTVKRAENRLPRDIVELIKQKRVDILGQFPDSLQKNINSTLLQPAE